MKNEYVPNIVYPIGETIEEYLDFLNLSKDELATHLGISLEELKLIMNGEKEELSLDMAEKLSKILGSPAQFWINLNKQYSEFKAKKARD